MEAMDQVAQVQIPTSVLDRAWDFAASYLLEPAGWCLVAMVCATAVVSILRVLSHWDTFLVFRKPHRAMYAKHQNALFHSDYEGWRRCMKGLAIVIGIFVALVLQLAFLELMWLQRLLLSMVTSTVAGFAAPTAYDFIHQRLRQWRQKQGLDDAGQQSGDDTTRLGR